MVSFHIEKAKKEIPTVMKVIQVVMVAAVAAALAPSALAQSSAPRVLSLELAQTMAQEALNACRAKGVKVTALVVDSLNMPKVLLRDDGATASSTETAKMKATTTMLYDRPSGPPLAPGATVPPAVIPGTLNVPGALPIKVGSVTIGAIAVSGAPGSDQDAGCAIAALAKVTDQLR